MDKTMKFLADCMVGKLARWLRILGFDVAYSTRSDDQGLIELAVKEQRILLTRDRELAKRTLGKSLLIESERWEEQLKQVLERFNLLSEIDPFTRCVSCNASIKPLPKKEAQKFVPPIVYEENESFAHCPECDRVFWKGSHYKHMKEKIDSFTAQEGAVELPGM